ncbi:hypothetical protein EDC96DRAFT_530174 [Choanephora cucurbitarum]|nr:hypothetical protein EDC96DRAFT_530174 [Choanephora cucurbitarum]
MTDPNLLFSSDLSLNLLSKSSPSQLQPFQYKRSRTQPASTETPYPQKMTTIAVNNSTTNSNSNLKPSNLSHVPCKFYKQGTCTAGANCTFSHSSDLSSESAVCKYFVKGNCKFGTKCALLHTMSPFGTTNTTAASANKINGSNSNRLMMASTPPQPSLLAFTGRRKTTDQVTIPLSSSIHNPSHPDHRSFSNDPFGSSAPAVSLFHHHYQQLSEQQQQQNVWRNPQSPRTNMSPDDFIGLHSSPRESSDYLLGTSPFANYRLYSSVKSNNSGFFNNTNDYRRQSSFANNTPTTAPTVGSYGTIFDDNHTSSFFSHQQPQQHQEQGYDLNDAMLPSSLNDLFTPTELQLRKVRQQEQQYSLSYSPTGNKHSNLSGRISRDATQLSSPDRASKQNQTWRVPFLTKSTQNSSDMLMTLPADYEDNLIEGTAAINIPSNNKSNTLENTSSSADSSGGSQHSYLLPQQQKQQSHPQQQLKDDSLQPQDDEVQFYMEDDEAVIMYDSANDHKALNNMTSGNTANNTSASSSSTTNNYSFPSLVNLPSM